MTLGISLVFMVYAGLILHYPIDVILFPMAIVGIPFALFIIGLGRAEGSKPGAAMWFVAAVLTFIILLAIAGFSLPPQGASLKSDERTLKHS